MRGQDLNLQPPGYELRFEVWFGPFQHFPHLFPTESNTFQTSLIRCSHCLFPILGQVMGQEVSGHSRIATEKTKKKLQNNWEVDSRRKPLTAEQRFFSLPLLKLQPARLSSGFGRFDNSPESPLVAPVKPRVPFYWQGREKDPLRRLIPVCAAPAASAFVEVGGRFIYLRGGQA